MDQKEFDNVEIPVEQQMAALKTVDKYAIDMDDKVMLCRILGIIPTPEGPTCSRCKSPLEANSDKIWRERRGDLCSTCYRRDLKGRKAVGE
jgi:hypothetical protein